MSVLKNMFSKEWEDYFLTAGSRLGVLAFSFFANVIITRTVGAEGRGLYALLNNSIQAGTLVASLGCGEAVAYLIARNPDLRRSTLGNGLIVVTGGAAVVVGLGWGFRANLPRLMGGVSATALALVLVAIWPSVVARLFRSALQGLKEFRSYNLCMIGRPASILILSVVLLAGVGGGITIIPYLVLLVTLAEVTINGTLANRHVTPGIAPSSERVRRILSYGLRAKVTILLQFVYLRAGIFLLGYLTTKSDVGIFSISASLAEIQMYVPLAIGWVWMPRVATRPLSDSVGGTKMLIRRTLPVLVVIAGLLGVVGKGFIPAVFGAQFGASYLPMLVLLPGGMLLGIALIISGFFDGIGKPHYSALLSIVAVAVIIAADWALIPRLGTLGAAVGSTMGYLGAFTVAAVLFGVESRRAGAQRASAVRGV